MPTAVVWLGVLRGVHEHAGSSAVGSVFGAECSQCACVVCCGMLADVSWVGGCQAPACLCEQVAGSSPHVEGYMCGSGLIEAAD